MKQKQLTRSSLLKKILLTTGAVVGVIYLGNQPIGEQTIRTETYQGHRMNKGVKTLYFNPVPIETRSLLDDEKTYTVKSDQILKRFNDYNIHETPTSFGQRLDSIVPYKTQ